MCQQLGDGIKKYAKIRGITRNTCSIRNMHSNNVGSYRGSYLVAITKALSLSLEGGLKLYKVDYFERV